MNKQEIAPLPLFVNGDEPIYQVLSGLGWSYRAPQCRSDKPHWVNLNEERRTHRTTTEAAAAAGIDAQALSLWCNAVDLEEEEDARAEGNGW